MKLFKNPSKTDLKEVELSVNAKVQRLKVTILFRFLNRVRVSEQRVCVCVCVLCSPESGKDISQLSFAKLFDVVNGML